jgi:hypothetical protein
VARRASATRVDLGKGKSSAAPAEPFPQASLWPLASCLPVTSHGFAFSLRDPGIQFGRQRAQQGVGLGRVAHLANLFKVGHQFGKVAKPLVDGLGSGGADGLDGHQRTDPTFR